MHEDTMHKATTNKDTTDTPDTLIVGAGFGGLLTAILLANQGQSVTLIEATRAPGGRALSTTHDGVRVNLGPHALYLAGEAVATLEDLGISIEWTPTASISGTRALLHDTMHTLPNSPVNLLTSSVLNHRDRFGLARVMAGLGKTSKLATETRSVTQWLDAESLGPSARAFMDALIRLTCYCDAPDVLRASVARAQLQLAIQQGVAYANHGWQALIDALVMRATSLGVEVLTETKVTAVERTRRGWITRTARREWETSDVVLAIPPKKAAKLAGATIIGDISKLTPSKVLTRDVIATSPNKGPWFFLGIDEPVYFSRVSRATDPDAKTGYHVMHAMVYCHHEEREPRRSLLEEVATRHAQLPAAAAFERNLHATVAHGLPRHDRRRPECSPAPGLHLVGDWVEVPALLLDAVALSATRAAETIDASKKQAS